MKSLMARIRTFPETAQRYDTLRKSIPFVRPPDTLVVTGGLAVAFPDDLPSILTKVKEFTVFAEDNDPWHEHDFGDFEFKGEKMSGRSTITAVTRDTNSS